MTVKLTNLKQIHKYYINKRLDIYQDHPGMQYHFLGH